MTPPTPTSTRSSTPPPSPSTAERLARIVELACRAPSVHNTQPWRWRIDGLIHGRMDAGADGSVLELYADHHRQLSLADPVGRNLVISCGAALHHAQVAARALGWVPKVRRLPGPGALPDLLACIALEPGHVTATATNEFRALLERCTDRRRFTSWPVPDERLTSLVSAAAQAGATAVAVTDAVDRVQVELAVSRALDVQSRDADLMREQDRWIDHGKADGIPAAVVPSRVAESRSRRSRFGPGLLDESQRHLVDGSDGIVILGGHGDDVEDWLATGEALSALWLRATADGLSVVPLSQAIEVEETRTTLAHGVLGGQLTPHLIVRVGWQPIGRHDLPRTPRRALGEVLVETRLR